MAKKTNKNQEAKEKLEQEVIENVETSQEETVQEPEKENEEKTSEEETDREGKGTTEMKTLVPRPYSGVYVRKAPAGQVVKVLKNGEKLDVVKSVKDKAGHEWKLLKDGNYIDANFVTE